jgi:hypothetical protein
MQPVLVSCEPDYFDRRKRFRRVRSGITQRRQLANGHQNLHVTFCETKEFRRCRDIETRRQSPSCPRRQRRLC